MARTEQLITRFTVNVGKTARLLIAGHAENSFMNLPMARSANKTQVRQVIVAAITIFVVHVYSAFSSMTSRASRAVTLYNLGMLLFGKVPACPASPVRILTFNIT
jgi:hypothetical protein